ncbi:hypothetical protein DUNSADRAFT_18152 [Dunaliella salina]|uniref:COX assembly mitochondrial protein n=1 Tax=Dunaliella salina TaxID=3046 RepID=A0ABQ7GZG9_DUNSA|nr:hypothetical protein DUNSADRAFT_18152 [Dunaliella salina]|eukprot:KAF5839992.1 hypothetical protein DUNSADRAFT_18152 [Dunaliella salina]
MHPQLIPERHPMCGKYMEELVKCREANPVRRFFGECNDVTYSLTKCLAEEKAIARAPKQAKYKEQWAAKREADAARMKQLEAEAAARRAAAATQAQAQAGATSVADASANRDGTAGMVGGGIAAPSGSPSSGSSGAGDEAGPHVQAASVCELPPTAGLLEWCSQAMQQLGGLPGTLSATLPKSAHDSPSPNVPTHTTTSASASAPATAATSAPATICSHTVTSSATCKQEDTGPAGSQAQQSPAEDVSAPPRLPQLQLHMFSQTLPTPQAKPACSFSWDVYESLGSLSPVH